MGLGYGICLNTSSSIIEYNLFNWNRHSIAGAGLPGCSYVSRHNVQGDVSSSHCFDMHGGIDRGDGTNIAGTSIEIYNNSFWSIERSVSIRGIPQTKCEIHHNWFRAHGTIIQAVKRFDRTETKNNVYGNIPIVKK